LFVDGKYFQTLTNCAPCPGNLLTVDLNGYPLAYTVPTAATLATAANGLAALINAPATTNLTQVAAFVHGDRIELHSLATNGLANPFYFTDGATTNPAGRYYSTQYLPGSVLPQLTSMGCKSDGAFRLHMATPTGTACLIQASTNLIDWIPILTNSAGGPLDLNDVAASSLPRRFYRALALAPVPAPPVTLVGTNASGLQLQVKGAAQSCVILESTNQVQWTPVFTNLVVGQVQTAVGSSVGSASALTTFLTASRSTFLNSSANGLRAFNVTGTMAVGAWLQISVTKTNGAVVNLSVTNQSGTATLSDLAQQLMTAINASPALQGSDGLVAEDLSAGVFGTACFNLRARSPSLDAAAIQVQLIASASLGTCPSAPANLNSNLSDLQPRNHLYVTAGAGSLAVTFPFHTTLLADGFHELAAVAYEGSHVRTQTKITLPIQIRNSSLSASLTLLDLTNLAPVQGTYHIQVAANTNTVSAISLFSNGGLLAALTNQPTATFTIDGSSLGAGLLPFYAQVQTADGTQYRTQVQWVRLLSPQ
jgi:hypothetical protein